MLAGNKVSQIFMSDAGYGAVVVGTKWVQMLEARFDLKASKGDRTDGPECPKICMKYVVVKDMINIPFLSTFNSRGSRNAKGAEKLCSSCLKFP